MFRPDGKLRKDALGEASESDGVLSERDIERARDRTKSDREVLREIRDELRGTSRGPAAGGRAGGSTVSKGTTTSKSTTEVLKEDLKSVIEVFQDETGIGLKEDGGLREFYSWLANRVEDPDAPGGGREEELYLEKIDQYYDEIVESLATESGTA